MRPPVSEAALQQAVLDTAATFGWLGYHTHDSRKSKAGFPDLVLVRAPRLLIVELKRDGEGLRDDQRAWAVEFDLVEQYIANLLPFGEVTVFGYRVWRTADWQSGIIDRELRTRLPQ